MREALLRARRAKLLREEMENPETLFYISFAMPGKFLGGVFVLARGPAHAHMMSHGLNINPGGSAQIICMNDCLVTQPVRSMWNKLLTEAELQSIGPDWENA